jgi:hypothetical protein
VEELHRKFKDVLLYDDLKSYLKNKYDDITEIELERAVSLLNNIPSVPLYNGSK